MNEITLASESVGLGSFLGHVGLEHYLIVASALFCLGLYGVVTSRNLIKVLMSVEFLLNAANINFVAFSNYVTPNDLTGQIFAIFIMTIAAAEAGVGLAIALLIYKHYKSVDTEKIRLLKW